MLKIIRKKIETLVKDARFSEIFTGSIWSLCARGVGTGLGMISTIIVARWYGAEMMGTLAILGSFLGFAAIFTVLGTGTSIMRLIPEHLVKYSPFSAFRVYRKTQYFVAAVSIFTGVLLFFASGFIAETVFSKPYLKFYFSLCALFIVFQTLMALNTSAVRGLRLIRMFAFMQLLPTLSKLVILVIITAFFYRHDNPVYALFASIAITAMVGAWVMDKAFKQKIQPGDVLYPITIRELLAISLPMLMTITANFVVSQTGIIMLGMFRHATEVGYYAIAVKLSSLTTAILIAVASMAASKFSELYHAGKMEDLFYVARKSSKLIFWTTAPILLILILFGRQIISLLYGVDFSVAYPAMIFLVLGQFVNACSGSTSIFMNMTGHQKIFQYIMFFNAFLNIALNYILIPKFGIYGTALAGMVCLIFWNVSTLCFIKYKFGKTIGYFPIPNFKRASLK